MIPRWIHPHLVDTSKWIGSQASIIAEPSSIKNFPRQRSSAPADLGWLKLIHCALYTICNPAGHKLGMR